MNSLPFAFYHAVTRSLSYIGSSALNLKRCIELSGLICAVAAETDQKLAYENITIDHNGRFLQTTYNTWSDKSKLASINPNYKLFTSFIIRRSCDVPSSDAIVAYRNVPAICLCFFTSTINKQFLERIYSLRFVSEMYFGPGSADLIPGMMRNFVAKKTLNHVIFLHDYVFDEPTATLLLDLLKQEQFSWVTLPTKSNSTLRRIIADWKENPEKFIGKQVITQMKSDNKHYEAEVQAGRIRECTEDERRSFKLYYGWTRWENPQISTNRKCGIIYWHCDNNINEINLLFA